MIADQELYGTQEKEGILSDVLKLCYISVKVFCFPIIYNILKFY